MDGHQYRRERENPSFSSTLLDAIYRSIDKGEEAEEELVLYRETMKKKHSNCTAKNNGYTGFKDEEDLANFQRACLIEKWMEKKEINEKVVVHRKSLADFERKPRNYLLNSRSSSSDSSSGGAFSSSEAESVHGISSTTSCYNMNRPKPIRTSSVLSVQPEKFSKQEKEQINSTHENHHRRHEKPMHEGGYNFLKTKSRALKNYGDLKKVKQPMSPGGRLSSFINSFFTSGNAKKAKISSAAVSEMKIKSANDSTCSSTSSLSRSCLSKTSSNSHGKLINGMKRSVKFYPVSVILGEDCPPCGQKSLYQEDEISVSSVVKGNKPFINEEVKIHVMEKNRRVEEAARNLLRNYQKKVECHGFDRRDSNFNIVEFDNIEDEDDAASYASSDLFELDNLSDIGIDRYGEELPVYETTHLDTNRAIANGFIL